EEAQFGSTTDQGFTAAQLYSTASYQAHELYGIDFRDNNLTGWNFANQNLTNASFYSAWVTGADFTGADIQGANFGGRSGLEASQLYSTASYQAHDLTGVVLSYNDLSSWDFSS